MEIYDIKSKFNFSHLKLIEPKRLQGGTYFSQINYNENDFYLNIPKCNTKNGIVKTTKRSYIDLLYSNTNVQFIEWILNLEKKIKELILDKSSVWFHNELSLDDVEYLYNSPLRAYKQKNYILRCYLTNQSDKLEKDKNLCIYDEDNNIKDAEDVKNNEILSIIQIKGVRFTNDSFTLELEIKQIMILDEKPLFSKFLIKKPQYKKNENDSNDEDSDNNDCLIIDDNDDDNDNNNDNDVNDNDNDNDFNDVNDVNENDNDNNNDNDVNENENENENDSDNDSECVNDDNVNGNDDNKNNNEIQIISDNKNNKHLNVVSLEENNDQNTEKNNNDNDCLETNKYEKNLVNLEQTENLANKINYINKKDNLENIVLDIQQITKKDKKNNADTLEEITINTNNLTCDNIIKLKKPNEVYYEIYKQARQKAKLAKKAAVIAYLEAKNIKKTYMLDDLSDSSDEEFEVENY